MDNNRFTQEEIQAAKSLKNKIINGDFPKELKSIYIAGEIVMYDELSKHSSPTYVSDEEIKPPKVEDSPEGFAFIEGYIEGSKAMRSLIFKEGKGESKRFDINFDGHVLAGIEISDNTPKIYGAMNGYGNGIEIDKIKISEHKEEKK